MKTAFVTGGSGFIGANLVRLLLERGWRVRALVRESSDARNLDGLEVERIAGGLLDADLARTMDGSDAVFHVAAHYSLWRRDKDSLFRSNVLGTINILRAAAEAGVPRVVYTSSVGAIKPLPNKVPADESRVTKLKNLIGPYKRSKFLAEAAALRAAAAGQDVVIVNPSTPIGPWDRKPTPTGETLVRFLSGGMPVTVDTGLNFVAVRDVALGHVLAYERGRAGERYILGNENLTLRELLARIGTLSDRRPPARTVPLWLPLTAAFVDEVVFGSLGKNPKIPLDGVRMSREFMYYESSKARNQLGYAPGPLDEGIAGAIDWFRAHRYIG
jgi:dihydroflavonol-4-reductase